MWFSVNLKGSLVAYLIACRDRLRQLHPAKDQTMEDSESGGRLSRSGDTSSGRKSPLSRKGTADKNGAKEESKVIVSRKEKDKKEAVLKMREAKTEKKGYSVDKKLHDIQNIIFHLTNANEVAVRLIAHEAKRWSILDRIVEREAKQLATQYRQLENTMQSIKLISQKQTIPAKEQWFVLNLMESMPRQDDASMEMDIRVYEERLLSQYRKALLSGEDKAMELEAVKNTIHQKRRVLDYLEQLVGRQMTPGPRKANSSVPATQALTAREPLRFQFARNDFNSLSQSGPSSRHTIPLRRFGRPAPDGSGSTSQSVTTITTFIDLAETDSNFSSGGSDDALSLLFRNLLTPAETSDDQDNSSATSHYEA